MQKTGKKMAEYLSPGVYVEEFESGAKPMEGVGTSTAGFIGLAERGPVEGVPQLVTNSADFHRMYGGYLSENEFGEYRYLAYAVEQYFLNGGTRCFISRVAPKDAACSVGYAPSKEEAAVMLTAKNPGAWGDNIRVVITPASKAKTQVLEVVETQEGKKYLVKNGAGFNSGDIVMYTNQSTVVYNRVVKNRDNIISFQDEFDDSVVDKNLLPTKVLTTCEFAIEVSHDGNTEFYDNLSFNIEAANYVDKKLAKSDLIEATYTGKQGAEAIPPFEEIAGAGAAVATIGLMGGSNGSVSSITASEFVGEDRGAGHRTGIQSFLDNDVVSLMAVPGVVDPNVQIMLVAHCEGTGSRFAVLDMPKDAKKVQDMINHRDIFDSNYAALYHPWVTVFDPLDKKNFSIPPSGSILGIYARSDNSRGVHKAPANEVVRGCVGLECQFNKGEQDILNPKGVNLIRSFPGLGI
ncbi:MAG: phage tail sheath subtilisin-like domain-containing protein, partial [Clostridium sp.]